MERLWTFLIEIIDRLYLWRILKPDEMGVRLFCGKIVNKSVAPGLHLLCPLLSQIESRTVTPQVVDLRAQSVTTSDNKVLAVSGAIEYEILHIDKAVFSVLDVDRAVQSLSLGVISHYINGRTYEECQKAERITDEIMKGIRKKATETWGLSIKNVWITDLAEHTVYRMLGDGAGVLPIAEEAE